MTDTLFKTNSLSKREKKFILLYIFKRKEKDDIIQLYKQLSNTMPRHITSPHVL